MRFLIRVLYTAIVVTLLSEGVIAAQSNWDKVLDRYELISSQCIELRQRIAAGESVSSKSVTALLQELSTLRTTLSGASGTMTSSQKKRFESIRDSYSLAVGIESSPTSKPSEPKQKKATVSSTPETALTSEKDSTIRQKDVLLIEKIDSLISTPILSLASESDIVASSSPHYSRPIDPMFSVSPISVGCLGIVELSNPLSYGAMAFLSWKGVGAYIQGSSSFISSRSTYSCLSSGQISSAEGGNFWGAGKSRHSSYKIIAGAIIDFPAWLSVYAGAGYGSSQAFWEDISGEWAKVEDLSGKGLLINAGVMYPLRHYVLSASATYMPKLKKLTPTVGIGICF